MMMMNISWKIHSVEDDHHGASQYGYDLAVEIAKSLGYHIGPSDCQRPSVGQS